MLKGGVRQSFQRHLFTEYIDNSVNASCYSPSYTYLNGSCYKYVSTPLNFFEANASCAKDRGGHLIDIHSVQEQSIVWDLVRQLHSFDGKYYNGPYIGLSNVQSPGSSIFEWVTGAPLDYTNWDTDFPKTQSGFAFCAVLGLDGAWATIPCDWEKAFICEMSFEQAESTANGLLRLFTTPIGVYIAVPFMLLTIVFLFYFATCTYQKRTGKVIKSIKLKLPKLNLPFNKRMRDYKPYDEESDEIQFNCFGPDESSDHGNDESYTTSKLRSALIK